MTALPAAREYVQLERAMQQAESAWRHEAGGPERAADMRRCFQKLWDLAYPPAELVDQVSDESDPCTCGHDLVRHDMGHGCIECRCRGFTEHDLATDLAERGLRACCGQPSETHCR